MSQELRELNNDSAQAMPISEVGKRAAQASGALKRDISGYAQIKPNNEKPSFCVHRFEKFCWPNYCLAKNSAFCFFCRALSPWHGIQKKKPVPIMCVQCFETGENHREVQSA